MSDLPTTFVYKIAENCLIHADVYRRAGGARRAPVLVYVHGGALVSGSRRNINPLQLALYLEAGFHVVSIDYRLAPETKLPHIIGDLQDAFRWIRERGEKLYGADPDRIVTVGHSAGGYLALMSGFCVSPHPRALISFYGYGDIVTDWITKPDPYYRTFPLVSEEESGRHRRGPATTEVDERRGLEKFYLYCRQNGLWPLEVSGHDPNLEASFFQTYCPVCNVSPDYPPTLLLHGTLDTDVPYVLSVIMAQRLQQAGVEHRLVTVANGGHGFDRDMDAPQLKHAFASVLSFLKRHCDPSAPG